MTFGFFLLAIATLTLGAAALYRRQGALLLSVAAYCAVTVWLTLEQIELLLPALVIAIAIETGCVMRVLGRELDFAPIRHISPQVMTSNRRSTTRE